MSISDYQENYQYGDFVYGSRDPKMIELEAWLRAYYKGEIHE
jgi:hypothetical protein